MFRAHASGTNERTRKMIRGTASKVVIALAAALATVGIAAGCGSSSSSTSSTSSSSPDLGLITDGTLLVGSDIPYPPFEQGRSESTYTGFDIQLVDAIAKRLNVTPTIQDTSFDTIFRDLALGKFDMVASATTITPDREKTVAFSEPYYDSLQSLAVKKGSDVQSTSDLSGKTVAAQNATTGAAYANDKTDAASVRTYAEIDDAFNALEAGQVDAVINDLPSTEEAIKGKPDLEIAQDIHTGEAYGFAFNKSNTALLDAWNKQQAAVIQDGTYAKIYKTWFHKEPPKDFQPS
jgi:polar amino acid transport system substrate-binding protein